jgi:hypothetical protein
MDYVRIHKLRRSYQFDDEYGKRYYVFALSIGGILINGMTYNASTRSMMFPSMRQDDRKLKYISAPGQLINMIREKVKQKIKEFEGEDDLAA